MLSMALKKIKWEGHSARLGEITSNFFSVEISYKEVSQVCCVRAFALINEVKNYT